MQTLTRLALALAATAALPAWAASPEPLPPETVAAHAAALAADQAARSRHVLVKAPKIGAVAEAAGQEAYPLTPHANPLRAYPPSCGYGLLPDRPTGPLAQRRITLYASTGSGQGTAEDVTLTVWRIACSSSGHITPYNDDGGYNAMTLLRFDRDASNEGRTDRIPTLPLIQAAQGSLPFDGDLDTRIRLASEPNTMLSDNPTGTGFAYSSTYVLENYPYDGYAAFLFAYPFQLRVNPLVNGVNPAIMDIPAYQPDQSTYPDAFAPLPLDGYIAAQWVNDLGHGLLMQVSEQYDAQGAFTRQAVFDLLTTDTDGNPFWLVGNAAFPIGATRLDVDVAYLGNQNQQVPWGRATLQIANCNELDITFAPNAGLAAPVPVFSGTIAYNRLFNENGMTCE